MGPTEVVYDYIVQYKEDNGGRSPSVREICWACNISSTSLAVYYLGRLEEQGRITRTPGQPRSIGIPGEVWFPAREEE